MPNIVFASNNKAHWPLSNTSSANGTFDSTRVPYAIELAYNEVITSPIFTPVSGNITWIHHRLYMNSFTSADEFQLIRAFDVDGNLLFSIDKKDNDAGFLSILTLYRDAGSVTMETTFPFNRNKVNTLDVKYENTGAVVTAKMYINGGLAATASWTGSLGWGQPAYFSVGAAWRDISSGTNALSEFIVADGDTRNARLNLLRPVASGGETDWVGQAAQLADDDPTSGMTSIAAEERQTLTLSAYTGAANISAVVLATQGLAGANGPQNMRHTIRLSTVNYDSPDDLPLGEVLQYALTDYQVNPASSLPWVGADLSGMEMGFISKL